jgi:glutamyl-tRNA reductase
VNLIVVGVSYRTAPVSVLERLSASPAEVPQLLAQLLTQAYVGEAMVLSTCNRVEVYASVSGFHGGLTEVVAVLAERAGCSPADLAPYAYVHYDGEAVRHAYEVATGLDSMVVGEAQILGQLRDGYAIAAEQDATGRLLHELMQQALRVGKRAHTETGIDRAGQTVVSTALELAGPLAGRPALVIGAGAMGSLALATLTRAGAKPLYLYNRDQERAARLASLYDATVIPSLELAHADLVVTATAATGYVITPDLVDRTLTIVDLAVPRDVDPRVAGLNGTKVIDLDALGATLKETGRLGADQEAVEAIVTAEVESFLGWLRGIDVAPTVAALRARAEDLVATELGKLVQRRPEFSDEQRADVARTVHRVVQRLLHQPTVRARELAAEPGGDRYTALLRELFDLEVPESAGVSQIPEVPA